MLKESDSRCDFDVFSLTDSVICSSEIALHQQNDQELQACIHSDSTSFNIISHRYQDISLYCHLSSTGAARPLVSLTFRRKIFQSFYSL